MNGPGSLDVRWLGQPAPPWVGEPAALFDHVAGRWSLTLGTKVSPAQVGAVPYRSQAGPACLRPEAPGQPGRLAGYLLSYGRLTG